jgi:hypothetical protein
MYSQAPNLSAMPPVLSPREREELEAATTVGTDDKGADAEVTTQQTEATTQQSDATGTSETGGAQEELTGGGSRSRGPRSSRNR